MDSGFCFVCMYSIVTRPKIVLIIDLDLLAFRLSNRKSVRLSRGQHSLADQNPMRIDDFVILRIMENLSIVEMMWIVEDNFLIPLFALV